MGLNCGLRLRLAVRTQIFLEVRKLKERGMIYRFWVGGRIGSGRRGKLGGWKGWGLPTGEAHL